MVFSIISQSVYPALVQTKTVSLTLSCSVSPIHTTRILQACIFFHTSPRVVTHTSRGTDLPKMLSVFKLRYGNRSLWKRDVHSWAFSHCQAAVKHQACWHTREGKGLDTILATRRAAFTERFHIQPGETIPMLNKLSLEKHLLGGPEFLPPPGPAQPFLAVTTVPQRCLH